MASLPNTFMDITWQTPNQYLSSLKSHYRRKILIHRKSNEDRGIRYELRDDFGELADSLCDQWLVVHESAKEFQRERLTPEFYREFSAKLGSKSKALLFYRDDELVGHVLLFVDGEILRWLYVGRKESVKDNLYFYMCHKIVETAILLRVKRLELGLTTYEPKVNLGAKLKEGGTFKGKKITYDDSCYLGRPNDIYEAPRKILEGLVAELVEMKRCRSNGLCCGAGGAQMFKEEEKGTSRINADRSNEAIATGASVIAAACPFCNTMITDGIKLADKEEAVQVLDVAELIAAGMKD